MRNHSRSGSWIVANQGGFNGQNMDQEGGPDVERHRGGNGKHAGSKEAGPVSNDSSFTSQQQKAIIEHLLITKNSTPQKNYSHVPCKFFLQGNCQAGEACPFSHSLNTSVADQTPCKYFQKGNCKFGMKCANAHVLSNGTRVNPRRSSMPGSSGRNNNASDGNAYRSSHNGNKKSHNFLNSNIISPVWMTETDPADQLPSSSLPLNYMNPNYTNSNAISLVKADFSTSYNMSQASNMGYGYPESQAFQGQGQESDLQLQETLLPNELSDLLTPSEFKRRESFRYYSQQRSSLLGTGSYSSSSNEPQLSYSSSSSSSDYSWRNFSSTHNPDYWQNLEIVEKDFDKFRIDEQDEDRFNCNLNLKDKKKPVDGGALVAHPVSQSSTSNDTQFFFDDLHGGIY